ncbi:hypothetical protein, partial [Brucella melitensis]|uniref:hypothetical protein n=1 Tax=Brucella melitensis TaxID=29459 RepID=UPI003B675B3C
TWPFLQMWEVTLQFGGPGIEAQSGNVMSDVESCIVCFALFRELSPDEFLKFIAEFILARAQG